MTSADGPPLNGEVTAELAPMDVAGRVGRLRAGFDGAGVDALLVTDMTNIRYLTGFTGSAALVLVTESATTFVTDGRYGQQAETQLAAAGVSATIEVANSDQQEVVTSAVKAAGVTGLGLEAESVTWAAQRSYAEKWFPGIELLATTGLVAGLRRVKDEGEIDRIAAACTIADAALAAVLPQLSKGVSEAAFALELDFTMRRLGAADVSFETIVASGPNGALPHHRPGPRPVVSGDLVVIDFGALVDGYHSDMTRTFAVGAATETQVRMYDVVQRAQAAGVARVAGGVAAQLVDQACRDVIDEAGWLDAFLHATGHGVGLDIHEEPRVGHTSTGKLVVGEVVTVEPGVYLPDHGGVRIEDTVVVTETGCRPLTLAPKLAVA